MVLSGDVAGNIRARLAAEGGTRYYDVQPYMDQSLSLGEGQYAAVYQVDGQRFLVMTAYPEQISVTTMAAPHERVYVLNADFTLSPADTESLLRQTVDGPPQDVADSYGPHMFFRTASGTPVWSRSVVRAIDKLGVCQSREGYLCPALTDAILMTLRRFPWPLPRPLPVPEIVEYQ
jgi:hypothetical protein